ncbi:MAG TPA: hypothetical protein VJB67_01540 [Patescibacteria group bacterium]|nr:hypothetical protein [Patescibacteria group bacterium]
MDELKGKKILLFQQRRWGINVGNVIAEKFQRAGCRVAAITSKRSTHEYILNQNKVNYELIFGRDDIMANPKEYLAEDDFSLAQICDDLNIDSVWPLVYSMRLFIRSYKDKYYYSFKQNTSDEEIIYYIKAVYKSVKYVFNGFGPDIIIAPNFVDLYHIMFNLYGKKTGVKMIVLTDSKVKGMSIFTHSYNEDEGEFYSRVDDLNSGRTDSSNREMAIQYIAEFRAEFKKPAYFKEKTKMSFEHRIRYEVEPYKNILRWYVKRPQNPWDNIGISTEYRPPKIILRDHYSQKRYRRFIDNFNYYPFDKLDKFVYFPLQSQPETMIDITASYFSNQIETARQVAMSLPDDYTLAVKEHPQMAGKRSSSYIEKIARTINVKLIDYQISSEDILKKADLVISPGSTTLAEAAMLNKPGIQLGNSGTTLKLPNIFKHSDMSNLSVKIKTILSTDFHIDQYEHRLENYVAAVYDTGYNVNYVSVWERDRNNKMTDEMDNLWNVYRNEVVRILSTSDEKNKYDYLAQNKK